jgi:hypothetical protein
MAAAQQEDALPVIQEDAAEAILAREEWKEKQLQMKRFLRDVRRANRLLGKGTKPPADKTPKDGLNLEFELLRLGYTTEKLHEIMGSLQANSTLEDWVLENLAPKPPEPEVKEEEKEKGAEGEGQEEAEDQEEGAEEETEAAVEELLEDEPAMLSDLIKCNCGNWV